MAMDSAAAGTSRPRSAGRNTRMRQTASPKSRAMAKTTMLDTIAPCLSMRSRKARNVKTPATNKAPTAAKPFVPAALTKAGSGSGKYPAPNRPSTPRHAAKAPVRTHGMPSLSKRLAPSPASTAPSITGITKYFSGYRINPKGYTKVRKT